MRLAPHASSQGPLRPADSALALLAEPGFAGAAARRFASRSPTRRGP